jgi:hypothetical protein
MSLRNTLLLRTRDFNECLNLLCFSSLGAAVGHSSSSVSRGILCCRSWIGISHVSVPPHVLFNADVAASAPSHRTRVGTGSTNDASGITQGIGDSETISYIKFLISTDS